MSLCRVIRNIRLSNLPLSACCQMSPINDKCGYGRFMSPRNPVHNENARLASTYEASIQKEGGLVQKMLKKLSFMNIAKRTELKSIGFFLYEKIADNVNYQDFFEEFSLPDTFYSWFVITELHVWMLAVRLMAEEEDGKSVRNAMLEALWYDVRERVNQLGAGSAREQVSQLSEELQAALIAYDEGLQSNDVVLASALWRRIFQQKHADLEDLELLVKYIRKQIAILDHTSKENLFKRDEVRFEAIKT